MHWTYGIGEPNVEAMNTTQGTARRKKHSISTSVLVIGTGGSGLRAAIEVAEAGVDVLAVGKRPKEDAHTSLAAGGINARSEEHTSELQSRGHLVCRLLLEKKNTQG